MHQRIVADSATKTRKRRAQPDNLKHNSRQILLLFVSADDLKQENGQILLKIVMTVGYSCA